MPGGRFRVTSGPDEGLEVVMGRAEVRIGRGAGANRDALLADQGTRGVLRIAFANGVYVVLNEVTNTLGEPIAVQILDPDGGYLDDFPPGTQWPWYANHQIRLTGETVLLFTPDEAVDLPDGKVVVTRSKPSSAAKKQKDRQTLVLSAILLAAAGVLFTADSGPDNPAQSDTSVRARFERVEEGLLAAKKVAGVDRPADTVLGHLREARFLELYNRKVEAADRYGQARDELARLFGTPDQPGEVTTWDADNAAAFGAARDFVAGRLIDLDGFLNKARGDR